MKLQVGDTVRLQPGTMIHVRSEDEDTEEDQAPRAWLHYEVGEEEMGLGEIEFTIIGKTGPHATMNGGGWDWTLRDGPYGTATHLRTSFGRDEAATFIKVG